MSAIILAEKLRRPENCGLARVRLEAPLRDRATGGLSLVVGPPGSGKSTLLARVAASAGVPTAWYRITADDGSEATVVGYLARALGTSLGIDITGSDMSSLLESLDTAIPLTGLLVMDDLHEIAGTAAERALERLVELRPPGLHILLGSRRQPAFNIPRLRVSGALHEVGSDDLRFRYWEVEELFESVYQEPLSPESAAALTRRTEGWAAGLQLFHLATTGRSTAERRQAVADLGGRSKLIRSYLARNVLAELPDDRRQFLLRTCTLGALTGPLCDQLLGITGSGRILDELEQQQLFTSSDDDGQTFRYHEVLRTHLELALVEEQGAAGAREWFAKSALLLESVGELRAAVRAYARAEDWGAVARLIQGQSAATAGAELLLPPGLLLQDPWLALADARRRLRSGDLASAVEAFHCAEALLDEPEFREQCKQERLAAMAWLPSGLPGPSRRPTALGPGRIGTEHQLAAQAGAHRSATSGTANPPWAETLREATRFGPGQLPALPLSGDSAARLAIAVSALIGGEFRWAAPVLVGVLADPQTTAVHRAVTELVLLVSEVVSGNSTDLTDRIGQLGLETEVAGLPWVARLARGLHETLLMATGTAPWRIGACADLLAQCDAERDLWGAALLQLASAVAGELAGDLQAEIKFVDAAARFAALEAPALEIWAAALLARHQVALGRHQALAYAQQVLVQAEFMQLRGPAAIALNALGDGMGSAPHQERARGLAASCGLGLWTIDEVATGQTPEVMVLDPAVGSKPPSLPTSLLQVELYLFGGFRMSVNGKPVAVDTLRPRARVLLRMLALHVNRDVHREQIIDALWPGTDVLIATRRLQVAVSSVRQLLEQTGLTGGSGLIRHGESYRLALPADSTVDLRVFEGELRRAQEAATYGGVAAGIAARESGLAQYTGDLLPEDGAAEYVVDERERIRMVAAVTATALAQDCHQLGLIRQAQSAARRSVQLDPFQDIPWMLLTELYESTGDLSAAECVRREHAKVLASLESDAFFP